MIIFVSALDRDAKVKVVDLNGRLLYVSTIKAGDTKTVISTDLPSSGELIYRITTGDTIIASGKILSK